jgi:hypothetical protein
MVVAAGRRQQQGTPATVAAELPACRGLAAVAVAAAAKVLYAHLNSQSWAFRARAAAVVAPT